MPHELLVSLRQKNRIRNAFPNNMSTFIKPSKAELFRIIQWAEILAGSFMKVRFPLPENILTLLATMAPASVIDAAIQRKMRWWEVAKAGKKITWVIFNDDKDDIIRIIKLLQTSAVSMGRVSEKKKHVIKGQ